TIPASRCNNSLLCCGSVQAANSITGSTLLTLLGIVAQDITTLVGITCGPINVASVGTGDVCAAQPVCCANNDFHGIVAIGCTPININL
ncbi:hydrophobin, partial [Infundibulicybe gibba]